MKNKTKADIGGKGNGTRRPKFVNICEMSIGDRPVTQTALVDIKKASIRSMGSLVLFGSMRRNVPDRKSVV